MRIASNLHRGPAALLTALLTFASAGCGGGDRSAAEGGRFDPGSAEYPLACMAHQTSTPGPAYTAGDNGGDTAAVLAVMRYYTANKTVASYCDGKAPSPSDRRWAALYVTLGADPSAVARILN